MPRYSYHHVHLMSQDAMAAGRFYETMFGAKLEASKGANGLPRANLSLDGQTILISTVEHNNQAGSGPHSVIGMDHLGLRVDDMDAAVTELKARGAEFYTEPRGNGPVKIAFVKAPDGVSVELVQYAG